MNEKKKSAVSPFGRGLVKLLGSERRQNISIPLFAILLSLIACAIVVALFGKNPLTTLVCFLQGSGVLPKPEYAAHAGQISDFMSMINALTPMIFAALAVAVALKTGLFNIGVSGQMLAAGFIASVVVGYSNLPMAAAIPLVLVLGVAVGGAVGALIGFLKHRFNINEVVSSIMLNYILEYLISFFINQYYINMVSRQSNPVSVASRLTLMGVSVGDLRLDLPLGILLAVPTAFLMRFLLDRTRLGFELKVVGLNRRAAKYAGINVGRSMVLSMLISGALAGLAGVTYYLGTFNSIQPRVLTSVGFDSIAVCLLGNSNPVGILFSSLLITIISKGGNYMSSIMNIPQEISQVLTGLILLFSACGAYIRYYAAHAREQFAEESRTADSSAPEGGERV